MQNLHAVGNWNHTSPSSLYDMFTMANILGNEYIKEVYELKYSIPTFGNNNKLLNNKYLKNISMSTQVALLN